MIQVYNFYRMSLVQVKAITPSQEEEKSVDADIDSGDGEKD